MIQSAPLSSISLVLYQSPLFRAPLRRQSCLPYKFVKMRSSSERLPNVVFVCGGGVPGGGVEKKASVKLFEFAAKSPGQRIM